MSGGVFCFGSYRLDTIRRTLSRDEARVDLNPRYFDALALMVGEAGSLVTKDRFNQQVWRGIPVTDEALTQCVRTLRQALGDKAAAPTFIETVPKHGYRFIAAVERAQSATSEADRSTPTRAVGDLLTTIGAATVGGGLAGLVGGIAYGLAGVAPRADASLGATSVLLVLICLNTLVGLLGGLGVGTGVAIATRLRGRLDGTVVVGTALGGLIIGGAARLLGLDAFALLVGHVPGQITGAGEGLLLGAGVGLGLWLAFRQTPPSLARASTVAALCGGAAGLLISAVGGRLMGGSLDQLARHLPQSRLTLGPVARLLGEAEFGPLSRAVTASVEGATFAAGVAAALVLARIGRRPR